MSCSAVPSPSPSWGPGLAPLVHDGRALVRARVNGRTAFQQSVGEGRTAVVQQSPSRGVLADHVPRFGENLLFVITDQVVALGGDRGIQVHADIDGRARAFAVFPG